MNPIVTRYAAAGLNGHTSRTVSEVQHDRVGGGHLRVELRQYRGDKLVGQAVEAVAGRPGLVRVLGQRNRCAECGV